MDYLRFGHAALLPLRSQFLGSGATSPIIFAASYKLRFFPSSKQYSATYLGQI
jgi:hypothetical protein